MRRVLKYAVVACLAFLSGVLDSAAQYDKDAFFMRGRRALADGKYAQAIENFNVLAQLDTADYWNFFLETGVPEYYLLYQNALKMEGNHVLDDPGHRAQGYGIQ